LKKHSVPFSLIIPVLVLFVWTVCGAIFTCPKCGYEQSPEVAVCTHCGEVLKKDQHVVPQQVADPVEADAGPAVVVREDMRLAKLYYEKENNWLAWHHLRNAQALDALAEERRLIEPAWLAEITHSLETRVQFGQRRCPICKGSGRREVQIHQMDNTYRVFSPENSACPICQRLGVVKTRKTVQELLFDRAQARKQFEAAQQSRGLVEVVGMWLPRGLDKQLSVKQKVAMKRAFGLPCNDCVGVGFQACEKCSGLGYTKCANKDCVMGMQKMTDSKTQRVRKKLELGSPSWGTPTTETCEVCRGKAIVPCEKCDGKAAFVCKTCSGAGQSPICTKCNGQGLVVCSSCKGSGEYRGVKCTGCLGEGSIVCTSCNGTGHKVNR